MPKFMTLCAGVMLFINILSTGYEPVAAAPPIGEVKTVATMFGNQVPIPFFEVTHAGDWMQLLYDPLVGCTPEGKLSPDLGLANRWEVSPDGLTWTFYLKKGVKFHDGAEVTAKDVKFGLDQLTAGDASSAGSVYLRREVKNAEVKDPYTVVVHCKNPNVFLANFLSNLEGTGGMVIPKDYYERVGRDEFTKRPVGSGPYKWHSQFLGSFIKLEATDKHWRDGAPKYKYMTYLIIPEESTRMAMLKTGEADIARISREGVQDAVNAGLSLITKENGAVPNFVPNMQWTSPVFSDIRFRKALNLAIDKDAIIKQIFAGLAKPMPNWPGSSILAVGGDPNLKPYPYDPQEARRLIKAGGWEGHEFTMMSCARAGVPEMHQVIETVAGFWQRIGLKPKIQVMDWAVWRNLWRRRDPKIQNTIHTSDGACNPDAAGLRKDFMEKYYFREMESCVNIPELNEKFEKMGKSLHVEEISRMLAETYRYAYDHYLVIPICEIPDKIATTKRVPRWNPGLRRNDRNYHDLIKQR